MKTKKKVLIVFACVVTVVAASVFGTLSYLTDSDAVINTFTVGKVNITLDEAKVTADGVPVPDAARVRENNYKLIPGSTYTKDPTVYIDANSSDCWVFVKVENGIKNIESPAVVDDNSTPGIDESYSPIITQMAGNGWSLVEGETNIYAYKEIVSAGAKRVVFEEFKVDGDSVVGGSGTDGNGIYYLENYKEAKIVVTAYAIQADGFGTAKEAWTAYKGQYNIN